ncbi:MAG TPA: PTS IIA-like nitrogen regulatory protein PtsN [Rhodocyclaceae bacterium]|nr:PTS IIA-like nitrogen regulatory protein PtsN [Rhodocyclaceae bacterium]HNB64892.1 PTS IIA-like nitrogen regulatory protein PtsN [Rhodocyclaceae bacterium]
MNLIAQLLPPANVVVGLEASSKKRAFEQAGLLFENNHGIGRSMVFDSLFAREKLGSTGLGQGIAIPHGRIKGLKDALGAFMRLSEPVQFDAPDGRPVNLLFVLLVPEQATEHHLQLLSELAQMFSDRAFRHQLATAPDAAAVHELFAQWGGDAADHGRPAV